MQAAVVDRYGAADVLRIEQLPLPKPGRGEVLVRVYAASVNAGDHFLMTGRPYVIRLVMGVRKPRQRVAGRDMAGVVEAVGEGVTSLHAGDAVFGENVGAFADYLCAPAKRLTRKPDTITFDQVAASPVAGLTALQALRAARLRRGQRVLINGAAGGVGSFAVQMAKDSGMVVVGVCSTANVEYVHSLGADEVIDYSQADFCTGTYDAVVDLVGNRSMKELRSCVPRGGTIMLCAGSGSKWFGPIGRMLRAAMLSPFVPQRLTPLAAKQTPADLAELARLLESGAIRPSVQRRYPLGEIAEAVALQGTGRANGKTVIFMNGHAAK
jgi:NADPH:quinone reductase-like Zn-dependent oxidoreductase